MMESPKLDDWLADLRALNRLFLSHLAMLARDARPCMNLPTPIGRRLRDASPETLDRIADLPVALFRLDLGAEPRGRGLPHDRHEQARWSLSLTILSSARHLARSQPFDARTFLQLSAADVRRLRSMPVCGLSTLARAPSLLSCAFSDAAFTWPALTRPGGVDERMLTLIALQPPMVTTRHARRTGAAGVSF
jgi:hypothetical protein